MLLNAPSQRNAADFSLQLGHTRTDAGSSSRCVTGHNSQERVRTIDQCSGQRLRFAEQRSLHYEIVNVNAAKHDSRPLGSYSEIVSCTLNRPFCASTANRSIELYT